MFYQHFNCCLKIANFMVSIRLLEKGFFDVCVSISSSEIYFFYKNDNSRAIEKSNHKLPKQIQLFQELLSLLLLLGGVAMLQLVTMCIVVWSWQI